MANHTPDHDEPLTFPDPSLYRYGDKGSDYKITEYVTPREGWTTYSGEHATR